MANSMSDVLDRPNRDRPRNGSTTGALSLRVPNELVENIDKYTARLMAGVEPAFAAKQLGHTTEMRLNTYADWISGVKERDQVNLLNQI